MAVPEDLYPIAVLIDELKHDDVQCRLNSIRKLPVIASALGPERTREELLPFLEEGSCDDEDEVLLAMAEQLGAFVDAVGGPSFAHALLSPLQLLAVVEETAVRDRAVASLNAVLAAMPAEHVERYGWPLALKLGERDWYSSRTAACGILPCVYARLPPRAVARSRPWASESKGGEGGAGGGMEVDEPAVGGAGGREDALELYMRLSAAEEVPMVRRAAAAYIAAFGTALAEGTLLPRASAPAGGAPEGDSSAASGSPQHIDTGDLDAAFAPAAVPAPVVVSAGSLTLGGAAAVTLLPLLTRAAKDDQDSVRLLACEGAVALARLANGGMVGVSASGMEAGGAEALAANTAVRASVLAIVTGLAADRSWRVRWSVANRFSEVARAFGAKAVSETLLSVFEKLAGDPEAEVRVAAAYRVGDVASVVAAGRLPAILPGVGRLAEDAHDPVRMAVACSILGLAAPLGTDATISALLPLFLRLLKDGSPHVRLNIIARLGAVHEVVGLKLLSSALLPAITDLAGDRAWRVRLAVLQFLPGLAKQLGPDAFVATPELPELCVRWLSDSVSSIREAGVANLKALAEAFGPEWTDKHLVSRVLALASGGAVPGPRPSAAGRSAYSYPSAPAPPESNYQARLTRLLACMQLAEATPPAFLKARLLPAILTCCADPVPNVRFLAAQGLERLARAGKLGGGADAGPARNALSAMRSDPDDDVRYFGGRALAAL